MTDQEASLYLDHLGQTQRLGDFWFHNRGSGSSTFAYSADYVSAKGSFAIDPALPLVLGSQHTPNNRSLFGAIADAAPDRWGRRLMQRSEAARARDAGRAARSLSQLDFVLGVHDELRQGAIRISQDGGDSFVSSDTDGVPNLVDLSALLRASESVESEEETAEQISILVNAGGSLGGARPKAAVRDPKGILWIAKFPKKTGDDWDVILWEKVALELARKAGIEVPNSHLISIGDKHVLLVERFDRTGPNRIHYASAMTLLEGTDNDPNLRSYLEIAEALETESPSPDRDLIELWRRIVFSVLISNTDDHLRNHGFLRHRGGWHLSPAFDLNPNPESAKEQSLAINEVDASASLDLVLSVAGQFRVDSSLATQTVDEIAGVVRTWESEAERWGAHERDLRLMVPAFSAAWL